MRQKYNPGFEFDLKKTQNKSQNIKKINHTPAT